MSRNALIAGVAVTLAAAPVRAQDRLVGQRTVGSGPVYESWSFGDRFYQPGYLSADSVAITRASQWSVPIAAAVPLGSSWTLDVSSAYSVGEVTLGGQDPSTGGRRYRLSGVSDVRIRATGRLIGDNVLFTAGLNAPTGQTALDTEQISALRVLASPALGLQAPAFGTGLGGTTGLVLARQALGWGWAFGASYEMRGGYAPVAAFTTGAADADFNPGDAVHLSLGGDGRVGQHGMTLALTADVYGTDRLSGVSSGADGAAVQLGPTATVDWQLRVGSRRFRELTFFAVDRYRSKFKRAGTTVPGTSGNYLDVGARSLLPVGRALALRMNVDGRFHSGLSVDNTFATAAATIAGATLGLVRDLGGYSLEPFARAQLGNVDAGGSSASVRGFSGGLLLGTRF